MTGCNKCSCNGKSESKSLEDDEANNTPPGIGFSFAMCHPPISQEADGFQLLVDSGSSKHFIDPELIRGVESRMQEYTRIEPPIEIIAAGNNVLRGTAQGILLVVVRGTDDALRTVKLAIVLVPGLKRNIFSSSAAAKKGVKIITEQKDSSLDLGMFSVQLTRMDSMEYLDLTIAKESRRTVSAVCAISEKTFCEEAVLTTLVPKSVAQPIGTIKVRQKVGEKPGVEDKNHPGPTVGDADKVSKSPFVSSCDQTRSNALPSTSTTAMFLPCCCCCCILHINRSGLNHYPVIYVVANPVRGHKEVPRSTGHIMVTTRYLDQQESKSLQKIMRLYKRWHRPAFGGNRMGGYTSWSEAYFVTLIDRCSFLCVSGQRGTIASPCMRSICVS